MTKKTKNGNNMSSQEVVENVLNINSYKAKVTVEVQSNKNKNKYPKSLKYAIVYVKRKRDSYANKRG